MWSSWEFSLSGTYLNFIHLSLFLLFFLFIFLADKIWNTQLTLFVIKHSWSCELGVTRASVMWSIRTTTAIVWTLLSISGKTLQHNLIKVLWEVGEPRISKWPSTNTSASGGGRRRAETHHLLSLFDLGATNNSLPCLCNATLRATCPVMFRNLRSWFVARRLEPKMPSWHVPPRKHKA